jgi:hypothetical protein
LSRFGGRRWVQWFEGEMVFLGTISRAAGRAAER